MLLIPFLKVRTGYTTNVIYNYKARTGYSQPKEVHNSCVYNSQNMCKSLSLHAITK